MKRTRGSYRLIHASISLIGVLWDEQVPIEGAATVLNALRSLGKRVFLVTNNSQQTRAGLRAKATGFGHNVQEVCTRVGAFAMGHLELTNRTIPPSSRTPVGDRHVRLGGGRLPAAAALHRQGVRHRSPEHRRRTGCGRHSALRHRCGRPRQRHVARPTGERAIPAGRRRGRRHRRLRRAL